MELKDKDIRPNEDLNTEVEPDFDEADYSPMVLTVDRDHIRKVAEEQGFKVEFDSPTPGVRDPETGEITSFFDVMDDFLNPPELTLKGQIKEELREHLAERGIHNVPDRELSDSAGRMMKKLDELAEQYADKIKEYLDGQNGSEANPTED